MRTSNSIKNSITSLIGNIFSFIIAFIAQAVFIKVLGTEYLGLNGLFTNVLSMLSIFELGIGNAIVFNLYKPLSKNDYKKVSTLMNFYKKAYRIIALLIFIFGILLLPFLNTFIKDLTIDVNIYIVYILFLMSTISSYLMAYKRSLIIADQKNYIINIIHVIYLVIVNISQLLIILLSKNYYLYLVMKIICQLLENLFISIVANRKYDYLKKYATSKLDKKTENDIFNRVKALFFHKIGSIIVSGTDNIIISYFFGIESVGLYTNYNTITNAVNTIFSQVISSTTASVGNLLVSSDENKKYNVFKKMRFLNFWISTFTSVSLLVVIQPLISLWIGSEYQLSIIVVCAIVFNFFQKMQRQVYSTFKDSAGIWVEDRFIPLIESFVNLLFSIIFLKLFGLVGVFLGTIISGLVLWCYSYPKFVYKKLFNRSYFEYAKETIGYILIFIFVSIITFWLSTLYVINNKLLLVIANIIMCCFIPNLILFISFRKTDNFGYFKNLLKEIIMKLYTKVNKKYS